MKFFIPLFAVLATALAAPQNLNVPGGGFQFAAEQRILQQQFALSQPIVPQVPGLAAHFAAEAEVLAKQGRVPGSIVHAGQTARVQQAEADLISLQQEQARLFL